MQTILRWLRNALGIKSPSQEYLRVYGPIVIAEMYATAEYCKLVLDYLQESTTNDAEQ